MREPGDAAVERFDVTTEDLDEIALLTEQMFGTSIGVARSDGRAPSLRLARAAASGLGIQRVTWAVDGRSKARPLEQVVFARLRRGIYELDQGRGRARYRPGDLFLFDPSAPVAAAVSAADIESVVIDRAVFERSVEQVTQQPRKLLDYQRATLTSPLLATRCHSVLEHIDQAMKNDLVARSPMIAASLTYLLSATALAVFDLLPEPRSDRPGMTRAVRSAIAYMDDHVAAPITVGDVAEHVGLSVRGLQAAFQRERGDTPLRYLRRARLAAVRRELLEPGPDTSVSEVALRWGFTHLGRFAGTYQAVYGESPRTTLYR